MTTSCRSRTASSPTGERQGRKCRIVPHSRACSLTLFVPSCLATPPCLLLFLLRDLLPSTVLFKLFFFSARYFLQSWPHLCFLVFKGDHCFGTVVAKMDVSACGWGASSLPHLPTSRSAQPHLAGCWRLGWSCRHDRLAACLSSLCSWQRLKCRPPLFSPLLPARRCTAARRCAATSPC